MKTLVLVAVASTLVGCASIPSHCVRNGALAGGLAATAGYVIADNSGTRHAYKIYDANNEWTGTSHYTTGGLYEKRGMVAATTGLTAGAITTAVCAARNR